MNKTIYASFYTRQEAENAINNLKNDILSEDNPVIIRDNQNIKQNNPQNNPEASGQSINQSEQSFNPSGQNQTPPLQGQQTPQGTQGAQSDQSAQGMAAYCWTGQMPNNNPNNFTGYTQQNLYNGYASGSTIGGLFGLATSAISMATIGAPYILSTTLANMFSYPMTQNQMAWRNTAYSMNSNPNNNCCTPSTGQTSQPQTGSVAVSLNVPEDKVWDIANSLKNSNAIDVRSS